MRLSEQTEAIFGAMDWLALFNRPMRGALEAVIYTAALAFDDEEGFAAGRERIELPPAASGEWPYIKAHVQDGLRAPALDDRQRVAWTRAVEAVFRVAGVEHVAPHPSPYL